MKRLAKTPEYWDAYARKVRRGSFQERIAEHKRDVHLRLVRAWFPDPAGKEILKTDSHEEAFGRDAFLDDLAGLFGFAACMDISPVIAGRAKKRFPRLAFVAADAASLPYKPAAFDLIVSNSTLDHLPKAEVPRAARELFRILKPGGTLVLTLDNRHNPVHVLSHWVRRMFGWFYTDRCYTIPEASKILKECGFRVEKTTAVFHIPFPLNFLAKKAEQVFGPGVGPLINRLIRVFDRLERRPTRLLTGRHIALRARRPRESG